VGQGSAPVLPTRLGKTSLWRRGNGCIIGPSPPEGLAGERTAMPILNEQMLDIISHSEAQTRRLGARLAALLSPGDVIALAGGLGTGKTRFAQGVGLGLGVTEPITSPTFTLVNEYHGRLTLYHIDLYRINQVAEALAFGLEDYLYGDGVCVIEWAERAAEALSPERLWITFHHLDNTKRRITMRADGDHYQQLLKDFQHLAFGTRTS